MRSLLTVVFLAAVAVGGVWAGHTYAPCSAPMLALAKYLPPSPVACPAKVVAEVEKPREVEPPTVTVASTAKRAFVDRLFVSGTIVAREEAQVAPRIGDLTIVEVDAEDGDKVAAGQVLARLDRTQLDALLAQNDASITRADAAIDQSKSLLSQSEVQVGWANDDFERARKLGTGVMSASTVEQRETALKTARTQLAAARNALSVSEADRKSRDAERRELLVRIGRTDVTAPVAGIVSRRSAKVGATASPQGEPLFRIITDGAIDLEAEVPEQFLPRLAVGMLAKLKIPGVADDVTASIRLVNNEVDKASRVGKVRIALADPAQARLGAFASGEVVIARDQGVAVPSTAVQRDADGAHVLVVKNGVVEDRKVKLGIVEGDWVETLEGLAETELVVARAASFLRPGDRVRPLTPVSTASN